MLAYIYPTLRPRVQEKMDKRLHHRITRSEEPLILVTCTKSHPRLVLLMKHYLEISEDFIWEIDIIKNLEVLSERHLTLP